MSMINIEAKETQHKVFKDHIANLENAGINTFENRAVLYSNPQYADKLVNGLIILNKSQLLTTEHRYRLCAHAKLAEKMASVIDLFNTLHINTIENWLFISQIPDKVDHIKCCFLHLNLTEPSLDTEENKQQICTVLSQLTQEESEEFTQTIGKLANNLFLTNEVIQELCAAPKNGKKLVESYRLKALFEAVQDKSKKIEDKTQLIRDYVKNGGDINATNKDKQTILHWAACTNELSLVQTIIDVGASVDLEDSNLATPLNCAADYRHENTNQIINLLCEAKANANHEDTLSAPLHAAVRRFSRDDDKDSPVKQQARLEIARTLINHGATISTKSKAFNTTALEIICLDTLNFDDTDLELLSLLLEKKGKLFDKDNEYRIGEPVSYLLIKLSNHPSYIPAVIKVLKKTCLGRMSDLKLLAKLCNEPAFDNDILLPLKKELNDFIKEHELPPNLNGLQRGIIDAVLIFIVEAIAELKPEDVIRCYDAMVIDIVSKSEQQKFEELGIWGCIKQIRDILQHPCPENRNVSYSPDAPDLQVGYSVYKEFLDGSGVKRGNSNELLFPNGRVIAAVDVVNYSERSGYFKAREKLGLLGLTSREDKKTPPVTKKAVADYIKSIIKQERLKYVKPKIEVIKPKEDVVKPSTNSFRFYNTIENDQVNQLLKYLADADQTMAEQMIKKNPALLLMKGTVTDSAGRVFKDIYPIHYPTWANDGRMANMMFDCLTDGEQMHEELRLQILDVETNGIAYELNGQQFQEKCYDIQLLLNLLEDYIRFNDNSLLTEEERHEFWLKIGRVQRAAPMHILQYYCAPGVDFSDRKRINRDEFKRVIPLSIYVGDKVEVIRGKTNYNPMFENLDEHCDLGRSFALMRGHRLRNAYGRKDLPRFDNIQLDLNTLNALWNIDKSELAELKQKLNSPIGMSHFIF